MKRTLILLFAFLLMVPGFIFSDVVTFKIGYFVPRYHSENPDDNLWLIEFDQMSFSKTSFHDTNFGFGYEYFLTNQLSLLLNVEGYSKSKLGQYLDYVAYDDPDGTWAYPSDEFRGDYIPAHTFSVSITPIQLSAKIAPLGRKQNIIPYIGGGIGIYLWNVRLFGQYIDFSDVWVDTQYNVDIFPIYDVDAREENKLKVGYHAFGGIMVPLANRISIEAEFKYQFAQGNLTDAFEGFESFDLSGYQISIGLNYWF
jgi:opacity protein-like surface antigen